MCLCMSESVSSCIPKTCEVNTISRKPMKGLPPIFGVFGFIDVLIRFSGQKVEDQGHNRRKHNRRRQAVEFHLA